MTETYRGMVKEEKLHPGQVIRGKIVGVRAKSSHGEGLVVEVDGWKVYGLLPGNEVGTWVT